MGYESTLIHFAHSRALRKIAGGRKFATTILYVLSKLTKQSDKCLNVSNISVLLYNFITGDNFPGLLKKWGHSRKKWGHCRKNDGSVIWRSKISFTSVYIITDHILTVNKQY